MIRRTGPAAGGLNAGDQFRLSCPAAAAVVAHLRQDGADRQVGLGRMRLVEQAILPASLTGHAQEPRGERVERLVQGLGA